MKVFTVNLEEGMPTLEQAQNRMEVELSKCRSLGGQAVKLIHGYGSSGVGGKLRLGLRRHLQTKQRRSIVKLVIPGEEWDIFDPASRKMLDVCPDLSRDKDLGKGNPGITWVLL